MKNFHLPSCCFIFLGIGIFCSSFCLSNKPQNDFCTVLTTYVINASTDFTAIKGEKDAAETKPDAQTAYKAKVLLIAPFTKGYIMETKGNQAVTCLNLRVYFKSVGELKGNYESLCADLEECLPSSSWNSLRRGATATYQQNTTSGVASFTTIQVNAQTNIGMTDKFWLDLRVWYTKRS